MTKPPGAPNAPAGRPPDPPPTPQCLFPSELKTGPAVALDSVGGNTDDGLLASVLSVLATTYDEQEVRERLVPTFVHGLHVLQGARLAEFLCSCELCLSQGRVGTRQIGGVSFDLII